MSTPDARADEVVAVMREHAKRITAAKRAVVDVLVQAGDHVTADDVTQRVQALRPEVSTSTVYRILEELEELGLAVHSHSGHAAASYHLVGSAHGHVACEKCHATFEVAPGAFDRLARELLATHGFVLDRHHVALSGVCAQCRG